MVKYLLEDDTFAVRAVTRNADSPAAQGTSQSVACPLIDCLVALKAKGAEVVVADLNKPETLPATVKGAYGVAAVTDCACLCGCCVVY